MKFFNTHSRSELIVFISVFVVCVVIFFGCVLLISKYHRYSRNVSDLKPKITRLAGLIKSEEQLQVLELGAAGELLDLIYSVDDDTNAVGALMQQEIRAIFERSEMNVTGSQIISRKAETEFIHVGLNASLRGRLDTLEDALIQLESMRPVVVVERIEIKPRRQRRRRGGNNVPEQMVDVRIQLTSFKAGS